MLNITSIPVFVDLHSYPRLAFPRLLSLLLELDDELFEDELFEDELLDELVLELGEYELPELLFEPEKTFLKKLPASVPLFR